MKGKLFKRVTALLSTAAMLLTYADFSALHFSVHAENGDETPQLADFDLNGNGEIDDGEENWGYELDSADDLYWFAAEVNSGNKTINAYLAKDITVNENLLTDLITVKDDGTATVNDNKEVKEWNYISTYSGTFDGAGHTISGLYYNTNRSHIGFVGDNHGTIKNLGIINSYFGGKEDVGTICGYMTSAGIIENCYSSGGIVKGVSSSGLLYTRYMGPMTGGVCGSTYGTIRGCYNYSKVIDIAYGGGGICGFAQGIIENCTNYGEVICNSNFLDGTIDEGTIYAGGICAYTEKKIINCSNFGNVTSKGISGGVAGCVAYMETECIVSKSFNKGKVTGYGEAGGICGTSFAGEIIDCYNTGDVNATGEYASIGGICGINLLSVKNCFNTGSLPEKTAKNHVGGICGDGYEVENCYYLDTITEDLLATAMTASQFASGEVCWLLNDGQSDNPVFYQNIGKDISPVLDSTHHAVKHSETSYYNEHSYENGFCTICDGYEPAELVDDTEDIDGDDDTTDKVYEISNAGQLYWFADKVNNENATYGNANAFLAKDIAVNENLLTDLINVSDEDGTATVKDQKTVREWTPIGDYTFQYSGIFNGNNKTISGLYFNKSDASDVGLFGFVDTVGKIQDVTIADSYFRGSEFVGGICGDNYEGTIENAAVADSYLYGNGFVGGVCGSNTGGSISKCSNTGDVSGSNNVGGVCGDNYQGSISKCSNTGDVSGIDYVGGVCGDNTGGSISNCYNTGDVTATGEYACVGGVCGYNSSSISNCYNTGDVTATGEYDYVGGVCGENFDTITNCYNTGDVSGNSKVGGVCGYNPGSISNCYNTGDVSGNLKVGGVCGYNEGTITNCYYLDTTAETGIGSNESTGSAETTAKSETEFASGEVCWLLNGGETQAETPVFYQNIGTDAFPVLDSTHNTVYRTSPCVSYSNTTASKNHSLASDKKDATCTEDGYSEYWYCKDCGKYFSNEGCADTDVIADIDAWKTGGGRIPAAHKYDDDGICTVCHKDRYERGECGDNATYKLETETGILTISGTGAIWDRAFYGNTQIKEVVIGDGITEIGFSAFAGCTSLTSVTFGENSKLESISNFAFEECESLESIEIPASVTSIGQGVFDGTKWINTVAEENNGLVIVNGILIDGKSCSGEVVIPDEVTSIVGSAFEGCTSITSVTFGENSKLESIGSCAFNSCEALESIEIPASVTSIGSDAFRNTKWIKSVVEENNGLVIVNGILIDGKLCSGEVVIPDEVTSIVGSAFYDCTSITSITFGENSKLESIDKYAFQWCKSLKSITIPDSVTSIGDYAFNYCGALESVTFGKNSNLEIIGDSAFYFCEALESVTFGENSNLEIIGDSAFYLCKALTSITIPASVTSIGDSAFYLCTSLTSITAPCTLKDNEIIADAVSEYGTVVTWEHVFAGAADICKCGEEENIKGARLILDGVLKVEVAFNTEITEADGWTINGKAFSTTNKTYTFEAPAKDFNCDIVIIHGNEKTVFSVSEMLETYKEIDETKAVAEALEAYCKAAENYFAENGEVADYHDKWESVKDSISPFDTTSMGTNYYGSSLLLKSGIILRHYYTSEVDNYTGTKDGYYYVDEEVPADEYSNTGKYSVNDYICKVLSSDKYDDNLKNLCVAIYNYGIAAKNYDNGGNN